MERNQSDHISLDCKSEERKQSDYISFVCNFDREGLRHLGKHLLSLLDWRSLVCLKRASQVGSHKIWYKDSVFPSKVWYFLQQVPDLEKRALTSKLAQDWGAGSPRAKRTLPLPGPCPEKVLASLLKWKEIRKESPMFFLFQQSASLRFTATALLKDDFLTLAEKAVVEVEMFFLYASHP